MTCNTRLRIWLSVAAVAYSTVGAVAQAIAPEMHAPASQWQSPAVVGLVLSCAGILIGVGAFVQTVKQQNLAIESERLARQAAIDTERNARQAFEASAVASFARKDVVEVQLEAIHGELAAVLAAVKAQG